MQCRTDANAYDYCWHEKSSVVLQNGVAKVKTVKIKAPVVNEGVIIYTLL